jgi:4-amino-4-deoxy-L-arabinose transferase-like glycosyltransferase
MLTSPDSQTAPKADLNPVKRQILPYLLILGSAAVLFFYKLGSLGLVGPDEPRYAQVAQEMFARCDLITPTLLKDTWFEKPALLYWLMIAGYYLGGVSEWTARLPNAVMATLNLLLIYRVARRAGGEQYGLQYGLWSALALAGSGLYLGLARAASFDMPLTFTFTLALTAFHQAETTQPPTTDSSVHQWFKLGHWFNWHYWFNSRRGYFGLFYAAIGLSLLAKGLVGPVLIGAIVGSYIILSGQLRQLFSFQLFSGALISFIVAATWYVPVVVRHGRAFINEFFIEHHFQRYTSNKYHHPGPVYFFVAIIFIGSLPWIAFFLAGLKSSLMALWHKKLLFAGPYPEPNNNNSDKVHNLRLPRLQLLALLWLAIPLAFFSFSNSKLPGYILPVFPAVALFAGQTIAQLLAVSRQSTLPRPSNSALTSTLISVAEPRSRLLLLSSSLILLLSLGLAVAAKQEYQASLAIAASFALVGLILGLLAAVGWWQRRAQVTLTALLSSTMLFTILIAHFLFPAIERKASLVPLARIAAQELQFRENVIFFQYLNYTPVFYTKGRVFPETFEDVLRVDTVENMLYYCPTEESILCITRQASLPILQQDPQIIVTILGTQRDVVLLRVKRR